ncbi:MAG: hypothetical protein AAGE80_08255 [Pseudomonadota bacterium]
MSDPTDFEPNLGADNSNPPGIGFWALVPEDLATHGGDLFSEGFWALLWHRFGSWRMSVRQKFLLRPLSTLYHVVAKLCESICGILLPYTFHLGLRLKLEHFGT